MTPKKITPEPQVKVEEKKPAVTNWALILSWGGTILLVAIMLAVLFKFNPVTAIRSKGSIESTPTSLGLPLPAIQLAGADFAPVRNVELDTTVPEGTRHFAIKYTVEEGDSVFSIAKRFSLKPESILWANYDLLNDDPTYLAPGWKLTIPPTDGIYYQWKEGDTLEKVAEKFYASTEDIISWPSNKMDVTQPDTSHLEYVMIPGGYRELTPWIKPLEYSPRSGATRVIAGPGGCEASAYGPVGTTAFMFPVASSELSGFDFSSYHLGIDLTAYDGAPVYASDTGTVIYAGWNDSGYGNLVVIDHNNGWSTYYAHLSAIYVSCNQGVSRGMQIAAAGNTGRSFGSHLHFEMRSNGGFVNPWSVLGY